MLLLVCTHQQETVEPFFFWNIKNDCIKRRRRKDVCVLTAVVSTSHFVTCGRFFNWYAQQKWFWSLESLKTTLKRLDMLNLIGLSDYNRHLFFAHSTQIVCFCSLKISLKYALVMHLAWKWQQTSHLHSKKNKVFVKKY